MQTRTEMERRVFPIEVRAETEDGETKLSGYAAVFEKDSVEMWGVTERIARGAFTKTLKEGNQKAFWNHDSNIVLGSRKSGTLRLKEDKTGLAVEIDPPDTQMVRDMVESIKRGDVDQMSFGFQTVKDHWEYDSETDTAVRTLLEVRLYEVSPVALPAYPDTSIEARCKEKLRELREQTQTEPQEHSEPQQPEPTPAAEPAATDDGKALAEALLEAEREASAVAIAQTTI